MLHVLHSSRFDSLLSLETTLVSCILITAQQQFKTLRTHARRGSLSHAVLFMRHFTTRMTTIELFVGKVVLDLGAANVYKCFKFNPE